MNIAEAVQELLRITDALHKKYPKKKFTLDGRLVGDLGEILVESDYDIDLFDGLAKHHDGKTSDGRLVQVKTTMKNSLTFPCDHVPEYYLGIKMLADGSYVEIFNGPGELAAESVAKRSPTRTNLYSVSLSTLRRLDDRVQAHQRIPRRKR